MKIHDLKTAPVYYRDVLEGDKTFELRKDDRGFEVGDVVVLREYDREKQEYTGRFLVRQIGYILRGPCTFFADEVALRQNYVIFQLIELGATGQGLIEAY